MRQTIKEIEVNVAYRWFLGLDLTDKVVKEMDYLFRMNDEAAEDRYKKLDETIRACQRHGREVAVGRETRTKKIKRIRPKKG